MQFRIDSWLLSRLRLADRRGVLTGPHRSVVQVFGLELLLIEEAYSARRLQGQDLVDAVRIALVSHEGQTAVEKLFPEWFPALEPKTIITEEDLKDTTGEWKFTEEMSRADVEEVLRKMGQAVEVSGMVGRPVPEAADEGGWL